MPLRLTPHRLALFSDHTYLNALGTCRICERPAGRFRTPICTETLAYCHRCLAVAHNGLSGGYLKESATARATMSSTGRALSAWRTSPMRAFVAGCLGVKSVQQS